MIVFCLFVCLFISAMFPWCMHIHVWHWGPQKLFVIYIRSYPLKCECLKDSGLVLLICFPGLNWLCWALTMCWQNEQVRTPISPVPVVLHARIRLCGPSQWGLLRESEASRVQPTIVQSHLSHWVETGWRDHTTRSHPDLVYLRQKSLSGACRHLFIVQSQGDLLWLLFCYVLFLFNKDLSEKFYT